ncbi:MAG: flavin reductase family protein [Acidobacteriota bacterium]
MLKEGLNAVNRWAIGRLGRQWVDYIASNTMTEFNRRHNDFIWTYELKALIVDIQDEADGVKTFTLLPNQHWKHMKAGQHIEVTACIDGQNVSRYYSLSSMSRGRVAITVKRVQGGALSTWLHEHARVGMALNIHHPEGQFVYRGQSKLLFICAGSGITPCHSMIAACEKLDHTPDIALYAQFSHARDTIFRGALARWKNEFDVRVAYTQEAHQPGKLLHAASLREQYPDLDERDVYLCGPQGFMDHVVSMLKREGFDLARLHGERFVMQDLKEAPGADFDSVGAEVYFQHIDAHISLTAEDKGKTLMEIAESRDLHLEVGCRQGMCGTCKLTLKSGHASGNVLGQAVYLCSAYPASRRLVLDT